MFLQEKKMIFYKFTQLGLNPYFSYNLVCQDGIPTIGKGEAKAFMISS
jgi:hypothetical protein